MWKENGPHSQNKIPQKLQQEKIKTKHGTWVIPSLTWLTIYTQILIVKLPNSSEYESFFFLTQLHTNSSNQEEIIKVYGCYKSLNIYL